LREEHRLRAFENRVLGRILGPEKQVDGSWRELHNDELHSLYSSPNIVRVIKSRMMRWAFTGFWLGDLKGRDHLERLSVGGRITLRWTLGM
jgi:hypothetical protein